MRGQDTGFKSTAHVRNQPYLQPPQHREDGTLSPKGARHVVLGWGSDLFGSAAMYHSRVSEMGGGERETDTEIERDQRKGGEEERYPSSVLRYAYSLDNLAQRQG